MKNNNLFVEDKIQRKAGASPTGLACTLDKYYPGEMICFLPQNYGAELSAMLDDWEGSPCAGNAT